MRCRLNLLLYILVKLNSIHLLYIDGSFEIFFFQAVIPAIWISTVILNAPFFLTTYFSKADNFCVEHWPEEWMAKAYSLTWFVLLGALPMAVMIVLYSRVVYSLWIKEEQSTSTQKVFRRVKK